MWKVLFISFAVSCTIAAAQQTQCTHDSQCAADECCYYHEGPMVVSKKRQSFLPGFEQMHQGGWCEKYKVQGQWCDGISKMNGHCECAPGLTCKWIPDPTLAALLNPIKARSMMCCGHSECQPI